MMAIDADARTALSAAWVRAYHVANDAPPWIFEDQLAGRLLQQEELDFFSNVFIEQFLELDAIGERAGRSTWELLNGYMRTAAAPTEMLTRQRFAEEQLGHAIQRGVEQYVVLGAGMDTYALRKSQPSL